VRDGIRCFAIVDGRFRLVHGSPLARQLCATWADGSGSPAGGDTPEWCLPPALLAVCRELQDEWHATVRANADVNRFRRRHVPHAHDPALTAFITMVGPNMSGLAEPIFLLELNRRVHGVTLEAPDQSATVLHGMTAAERAVALVLADGLSNQEIADRLQKTVHAVKFLLHRIYQKTGIPSRAALVAVLRAEDH
jgi:DNA-binding CsgD family transcriptional regulator